MSVHDDASLREALQERESAYEKLAQAMTAYCAIKHPSLEARQMCLLDKRLELQHIRQRNEEEAGGISSDQTRPPRMPDMGNDRTLPLVKCERAGEKTTCQRLSRAFVESLSR